MRGKETSIKDKKKVIQAKLNNPELSLRDIQDQTGILKDTASRIIDSLPELATSGDKESKMIDDLDEIISDIKDITKKQIKKYKDKDELTIYDVKQLNEIAKTNFERKQLLTGGSTKNIKINNLKELGTDELLGMIEDIDNDK